MQKIIVVSTNNNPDYYFYSPYILKAWNSYGWKVAVVITHDVDPANVVGDYIIQLPDITGLRTETQAQGGRLYAANYLPVDSLVMTSDMDLLPLFDYWHPKEDEITVYGHDLTWRSFYPMGYICMTCAKWKEVMNLKFNTKDEFLRDANETQIAFKPDWESWWNFDWDLITKRLKPMHDSITFIDRGQINIAGATLAYGRVDRYNWEETQNQPAWIDAHCENNNVRHPDKLAKFLKVFEKVYGKL
jgi:hypothetical protein